MNGFFASLVETDLQSGLSRREIAKLADKTISTGNDLLFITIPNTATGTKAVGFINKSLCAALGWDLEPFQYAVQEIMDNVNRRNPDRDYKFTLGDGITRVDFWFGKNI